MSSLPKPNEPEYKSWSLEKLQSEYFRERLLRTAGEIRESELRHKVEAVERFLDAFKELSEVEGKI